MFREKKLWRLIQSRKANKCGKTSGISSGRQYKQIASLFRTWNYFVVVGMKQIYTLLHIRVVLLLMSVQNAMSRIVYVLPEVFSWHQLLHYLKKKKKKQLKKMMKNR